MSDVFDDLPEWIRSRVVLDPDKKNWEKCEECRQANHKSKLKVCSGCKPHRFVYTYYCDAKCQEADWPVHKQLCKAYRKGPLRGENHDDTEDVFRRVEYWNHKYHFFIQLILDQIYMQNQLPDPSTIIFIFHLEEWQQTMRVKAISVDERSQFPISYAHVIEQWCDSHGYYILSAPSPSSDSTPLTTFGHVPLLRKVRNVYPFWPWILALVSAKEWVAGSTILNVTGLLAEGIFHRIEWGQLELATVMMDKSSKIGVGDTVVLELSGIQKLTDMLRRADIWGIFPCSNEMKRQLEYEYPIM